MDSQLVNQLFRQLFRHHPACQSQKHLRHLATATAHNGHRVQQYHRRQQRRPYSSQRRGASSPVGDESQWQQRTKILNQDMTEEYKRAPMVTAAELWGRKQRPRRVKMLLRDFIEDSLYNPNYGYFSKQVTIFTPGEPFDFPNLRDETEFQNVLSQRYVDFEDKLDEVAPSDTRQLWYTPTELFRPYYGEAIARYLVANYKLTTYPYHDLIIYEMGAGRGTLMLNILDYIRDMDPDVYARTQYKVIEISDSLAKVQNSTLMRSAAGRGHLNKVEIINQSIFDWTQPVPSPCFFLAFEVFDNFAHDAIRYDLATETPMQAVVLISESNDFFEFYSPVLDPVAARYFRVRDAATGGRYKVPYPTTKLGKWVSSIRPLRSTMSEPEYIPTRLMQFFDVLSKYFPAHRLLTSDFHSLPDAVPGVNAPIVQTRYQRRPVPVTTPLVSFMVFSLSSRAILTRALSRPLKVHQGYFDIMFPTDFRVSELVYQAITGKLSRVMSHEEFMRSWAYLEETETQSGENPLLKWYKNASVMYTV
ncbi:hypothetical protein NEUTE1DRAFT_55008 [Neurospora tetrasperma FGSC 2508]|uniref:Protein arginine methyltransferase NDUFAF7 n=1 Tax=Neurospora tetrasperma (strain FGSC 2508 / ATCC MYA-4615 / P0657) TaxID=510951 RepID=F8N1C2_NEUT8|nr:uncharacterized protein NEUTE1DRAFT_55008 [Neurospora tetrasperma FGSC 2508]EGO53102.1 hypothetical protein NEUTE1DRAFT_55008 [Neurospora tetrasperma FGSC 2508]